MKCPHCGIEFHPDEGDTRIVHSQRYTGFCIQSFHCPSCEKYSLFLQSASYSNGFKSVAWSRLVMPSGASRGPTPIEVPSDIADVYREACEVLPISSKASAALSRRILQTILHNAGYTARDLNAEIELVLNETNPAKAIPQSLRETIDGIRNFGNFSAHPVTDKTTLNIVDVEPEEAEWCLEIIEELFQHYYVRPAAAQKKKDALNAKLAAAGKPTAK